MNAEEERRMSLKNAYKCFFGDNPVLTAKLSKISRSKAEKIVKRERVGWRGF